MWRVSRSGRGIVYNVLLCAVYTAGNCYNLLSAYTFYRNLASKRWESQMDAVWDACRMLSVPIILAAFCFRQGAVVKMANRLPAIRRLVWSASDGRVDIGRIGGWRGCWPLQVFCLSLLYAIYVSHPLVFLTNANLFVFCTSLLLRVVMFVALIAQYAAILSMARSALGLLNRHLCHLKPRTSNVNVWQVQDLAGQFGASSDPELAMAIRLDKCRHIYRLLLQLFCELNEFYSPSLLVAVVYACSNFILGTSTIVRSFKFFNRNRNRISSLPSAGEYRPLDDLNAYVVLNLTVFNLIWVCLLLTLTNFTTAALKEGKEMERILSDLLDDFDSHPFFSRKIHNFLTYSSITNLDFKVYGLFSLKRPLLLSVLHMTVTYVVIISDQIIN